MPSTIGGNAGAITRPSGKGRTADKDEWCVHPKAAITGDPRAYHHAQEGVMTAGSELFGWGEPGARSGGQTAAGEHDFVRSDRGDVDDHWSHADGEACAMCGAVLTDVDFVRRRHDGGWVHESCPPKSPIAEGSGSEAAPE